MTLLLGADRQENAMAEEYETFEARLAEARRAVERWDTGGGAQQTEELEEQPSTAPSGAPQRIPPGKVGQERHHRGASREGEMMSGTTIRRMQLRDLAHRVAVARAAVARRTTEREAAIRRDGIAHPRSIRASRRLTRTQSTYRGCVALYRQHADEDARHER